MEAVQADEEPQDRARQQFFDVAAAATVSVDDFAAGMVAGRGLTPEVEQRATEAYYELFGRTMQVKVLFMSEELALLHVTVGAGDHVLPHRHGTHQATYVLEGSLHYGNQVVGPGMGSFTPDTYYSWTAGPEGVTYLEIHSGFAGLDLPQATRRRLGDIADVVEACFGGA